MVKHKSKASNGNGSDGAGAYETGIEAGGDKFVAEMLQYVKYLAHRIATALPPYVDLNDLVSYGVIGLLDAYKKYDKAKGVKFKTYAEIRIRGAILDGMRAADWAPRSVRRNHRAVENAYRFAEQEMGMRATDERVAEYMQMGVNEFHELVRDIGGVCLVSLGEIPHEDTGGFYSPEELSPHFLVEREELRDRVAEAVSKLPERERTICSLYYYDELTMKEIGRVFGVSESRVSQIHTKIMSQVKDYLSCANNRNGESEAASV